MDFFVYILNDVKVIKTTSPKHSSVYVQICTTLEHFKKLHEALHWQNGVNGTQRQLPNCMYLIEKLGQPNKTKGYKDRTWNPIGFNKEHLLTFAGMCL